MKISSLALMVALGCVGPKVTRPATQPWTAVGLQLLSDLRAGHVWMVVLSRPVLGLGPGPALFRVLGDAAVLSATRSLELRSGVARGEGYDFGQDHLELLPHGDRVCLGSDRTCVVRMVSPLVSEAVASTSDLDRAADAMVEELATLESRMAQESPTSACLPGTATPPNVIRGLAESIYYGAELARFVLDPSRRARLLKHIRVSVAFMRGADPVDTAYSRCAHHREIQTGFMVMRALEAWDEVSPDPETGPALEHIGKRLVATGLLGTFDRWRLHPRTVNLFSQIIAIHALASPGRPGDWPDYVFRLTDRVLADQVKGLQTCGPFRQVEGGWSHHAGDSSDCAQMTSYHEITFYGLYRVRRELRGSAREDALVGLDDGLREAAGWLARIQRVDGSIPSVAERTSERTEASMNVVGTAIGVHLWARFLSQRGLVHPPARRDLESRLDHAVAALLKSREPHHWGLGTYLALRTQRFADEAESRGAVPQPSSTW